MSVRWGILATGGIATAFVTDLKRLPDADIAAVGSRSPSSARRFADTHGIPKAYGSWQALADDPDIDVVYVATPHSAHHAATSLLLEAGKAVLCEKPLTLGLATSQNLVDTARAKGVFLMEGMWMRTNPAIRRVTELLADGAIGEVTHVYADFGIGGTFASDHRLRDPALGGGALLDLGVYPIALAHLVLGSPSTIVTWANIGPEGTDENTGVILGYDSGAVATLHCGIVGESAQRATITGTRGRIEIAPLFFRPDGLTLVRSGEAEEISVPYRGNGMGHEAEEVMRCLGEGLTESPLVPLDATLDVMRILDEALTQLGVVYPEV